MTNLELLEILQNSFPDIWKGDWPEYPDIRYSNKYVIDTMERMVTKLGFPQVRTESVTLELSAQQVYLASSTLLLCHNLNAGLGDALYNLMHCLADNGNTVENVHEFRPSEHLFYYFMINSILLAVKTVKQ